MNGLSKKVLPCLVLLGLHASVSSALEIEDGLVMNEREQNDFVLSLSEAIGDHPISLEAFSLVAQSQAMLDVVRSNQKPQIALQGNTRNSLDQKFEDPSAPLLLSQSDPFFYQLGSTFLSFLFVIAVR